MSTKRKAGGGDPASEVLAGSFHAIGAGAKKLRGPVSIIGLTVTLVLCAGTFLLRRQLWAMEHFLGRPVGPVAKAVLIAVGLLLPLFYLALLGQAQSAKKQPAEFESIGFLNRDGTPPELVYRKEEKHINRSIDILGYRSYIPLDRWRASVKELEVALNCNIRSIVPGKDKRTVELLTVSNELKMPHRVDWKDEFKAEEDGVICVGQDLLQQVTFNLNKTPHVIVAGETGSGKSVILRTILWQAILKECRIYMIDFKGGVEFGKRFEQYGEVITERDRALVVLKMLVAENSARLSLFREMEVKNLPEYNQKTGSNLCRIMVFIDEIAEMLDKTGAADKELYAEIEGCLSTLARLSRATGINLIIGVQRPDAKILTGQIKNNVPVRICGRFADRAPSEIVLGNSMATGLPDVKGRFLYRMGNEITEFQAFLFDDDAHLRSVDIEPGPLLIADEGRKEERMESPSPAKKKRAPAGTSRRRSQEATGEAPDTEFEY